MALYSSNDRYVCVKCGYHIFREKEVFLLEEEKDHSKLSSPSILKKASKTTAIICDNSDCNYPVYRDVQE